jgi:hypothetical protein
MTLPKVVGTWCHNIHNSRAGTKHRYLSVDHSSIRLYRVHGHSLFRAGSVYRNCLMPGKDTGNGLPGPK